METNRATRRAKAHKGKGPGKGLDKGRGLDKGKGPGKGPAQPSAPAPARLVFTLQVPAGSAKGAAQMLAGEEGVTYAEVVHHLADALSALAAEPGRVVPTLAALARLQKAQTAMRDYPAVVFYVGAKKHLCVACQDLYGDSMEGPEVPETDIGGSPKPCDFHKNDSFPRPLDEAAKAKADATPQDDVGSGNGAVPPEAGAVPPVAPAVPEST